jgi:hypothetical protein
MRGLVVIAFFVLPALGRPSSLAHSGPVIDVGYASFLGNSSVPGVHFFGGIPYVQPPLGDLRWRAPVHLDETPRKIKNVTDARQFGEICLQQPATLGTDGMCAMKNVHALFAYERYRLSHTQCMETRECKGV